MCVLCVGDDIKGGGCMGRSCAREGGGGRGERRNEVEGEEGWREGVEGGGKEQKEGGCYQDSFRMRDQVTVHAHWVQ